MTPLKVIEFYTRTKFSLLKAQGTENLFKTILILLSSTMLSSIFTFVTQVTVARYLYPEEFGLVIASLTLVVLIAPLLAIGLDGYLLKHFAKYDGISVGFINTSFKYFLCSIPPTFVLFFFVGSDIGIFFYLLVVSQFFINITIALKQVEGSFNKVSVILTFQSFIRLALLLPFVILSNISVNIVYFVYVFSSLIVIVFTYIQIKKTIKVSVEEDCYKISLKQLFLNSYPFGIGVFLHLIYFQSAILILGKLDSAASAGLYGVAFTILTLAYLVPGVVFQRYFLPEIHRLTEKGKHKELMHIFSNGFMMMLILGVVGTLLFKILSEHVIYYSFGDNYLDSVLILKTLSICILLRYLSSSAGVFLVSGALVVKKNKYMAICAFFNFLLNIILIPSYGIFAAVYVTICSEVILMLLFFRGVFKYKFFNYSPYQLFLRS